ncbi:MAG: hypothetical protein KVP17_001945 [Porospora cf. gigantea B]|uniref:uncharacterized protein n=2 Tax=Porospora cf. gigantea B TaxID=2853592 RepID=UPI00357197BF|nr:MAG: hypothetical protein KVP17_001945 [Porospora cf. gigantea B]
MESARPIDVSGLGHHAAGDLYASPGLTGAGYSALFRNTFVDVPRSPIMDEVGVGNFSLTFFISVLEDAVTVASRAALEPNTLWCPIIHKGHETVSPPSVVAMPAVFIDVKTRQLKVVLSTEHLPSPMQGEFLTSNSRLLPKRSYHIAVVRFEQRLRLYVNGVLDSTILTLGCNKPNSEPFFVGGAAWSKEMCDVPIMLDEVKLYAVALGRDHIQAEASATLGGTEPGYCMLSCVNCTKSEAAEGCPETYHLCSRLEWLTDVYSVARGLGLLGPGVKIHSGDAPPEEKMLVEPKEAGKVGLGVAFCCVDLPA